MNARKAALNPDRELQAYVIGLAIGDGNLSNPNGRAVRLRITCDTKYPRLVGNIFVLSSGCCLTIASVLYLARAANFSTSVFTQTILSLCWDGRHWEEANIASKSASHSGYAATGAGLVPACED